MMSRFELPLHLDGGPDPVAVLVICAYCGTGNLPYTAITPTPPRAPWRPRPPWAALLWVLHRALCKRHGQSPMSCAYGDCRRPGWYGCQTRYPVDDGDVVLLFCGARHRRKHRP